MSLVFFDEAMSLVFFDLETGGLDFQHPNIQLAAVAVDNEFNELETFEAKIKFDVAACDPIALEKNSYEESAWRGAESEGLVAKGFAGFLSEHKCIQMVSNKTGRPYWVARLAGHNVTKFDGPRLKEMFKRHGLFLPAHPAALDTTQLALWKYQRLGKPLASFRLTELCKLLDIPVIDAHDALGDVRMNVKVAKRLLLGK